MMFMNLPGWALLFVAMAVGYFVVSKAAKEEKKLLAILGLVIGAIILLACLTLGVLELNANIRRTRTMPPMGPRRATTPTRPMEQRQAIPAPPTIPIPPMPAK